MFAKIYVEGHDNDNKMLISGTLERKHPKSKTVLGAFEMAFVSKNMN